MPYRSRSSFGRVTSVSTLALLSAARDGEPRDADVLFPRVCDAFLRLSQGHVVYEASLGRMGGGDGTCAEAHLRADPT